MSDFVNEIDGVLERKPELIFICVSTNGLRNDLNLLSNVKLLVEPKIPPLTVLGFSNIFRKDKKNIEQLCGDANSHQKNFCNQKNTILILNNNLKEKDLRFKKMHLNRKGNSALAKNFLSFIERN